MGNIPVIITFGFLVWHILAPTRRGSKDDFSVKFLAYMLVLLASVVASADVFDSRPNIVYFVWGGVLAWLWNSLRLLFGGYGSPDDEK
ncbi:MAG: hypothetical protein N3A57_07120 [Negativicutes bacterium]|nr:hypothetical protein [Negativicutes bacterium]